MATQLGELRTRVRRLLGDMTGEGYTDDLLLDAIGAAHDAILPWVPKTGSLALTGDGTATSFDLPADLYSIEACVVRDTGEVLQPGFLFSGKYTGQGISGTNDWNEYPTGHISFSLALDADEVYDLYYLAYWSKPTSTSSPETLLEPPDYVMVALSLYAAAYCLLPAAIQLGEIRQFATKVDSGTPEDNPMQKNANYLFKLFTAEMNRHPKYQRTQR